MSLNLFTPETKIHKQRNIMRDTDWSLARYSKRGIALSLVIYFIAIFLGDFYQQYKLYAIIFGLGLVISTIIRGYLLFRFDSLYARAPSRWRNQFFFITLVAACWWGLMLAFVTYKVGLKIETPLLWFYTIAFFSSCSHIFAPYHRFYTCYLFFALLPCSVVALLSFDGLSSIYGLVMLILIFLLKRQGGLMSDAYWGFLQANYDLTQRANALEAEKISSESTLSNKDALFINLAGELRSSLREIIGSLQILKFAELPEKEERLVALANDKSNQQMNILQNLFEFSSISRKEIVLDTDVIDLRDTIEKSVISASIGVYKKNIEIFTEFSNNFPMRVRGDAKRLEQILVNLITTTSEFSEEGYIRIKADYFSEKENIGKVRVAFLLSDPIRNSEIEQQLYDLFQPHHANNMSQGLSLAIAKGLANCMSGDAGANYTKKEEMRFWFTAQLETVTHMNSANTNITKVNGKRLLLFQPPQIIENEYKVNLEAWGFIVDIFYEQQDALTAIKHSLASNTAFDLIFIYTKLDDLNGMTLISAIKEIEGADSIHQILCLTRDQSKLPQAEELRMNHSNLHIIHKPIVYKQLKGQIKRIFVDEESTSTNKFMQDFLTGKNILLLQKEEIDLTLTTVMLEKLGCNVQSYQSHANVLEELKTNTFDAFITESFLENVDMQSFIDEVKSLSQNLRNDSYQLPVLGLNLHEEEGEETRCLQVGMDYYIDLPLQIDDLRAILRRWIGRAVHMAEIHNDPAVNGKQ
jgi:CheY-like chemotaxis protein/signal transduction histidine kinase